MQLIGRRPERETLDALVDSVRGGMSRTLVLCGEPGIGKSALLNYAVESAPDLHAVRTVAIEPEKALAFSGLHQLLMPFLAAMDGLPEPQKRALGVSFGRLGGPPADPFLVGLAVLTLLSESAQVRPVVCVIDDAQWLDDESANILCFVARRLLADRVGMLFGLDEPPTATLRLPSLPLIRLDGLSTGDARELLRSTNAHPIDGSVAERIATMAGGNPLALLAAARELSADQLAGQAPLPEPLPIGHVLEESFARRVLDLSPDTRTLLLLAAADQPGQANRLLEAATALGIPDSAAEAAEAAGIAVLWPEVKFSHPLVRSAVYHAASPLQRRQAHRALAAAADADLDLHSRAWHLAAAAAGPDEEAAAAQEAAAGEAETRGGFGAAAALLERAAALTPDLERRAERRLSAARDQWLAGAVGRAGVLLGEAEPDLLDPVARTHAIRLKGRIQLSRGHVAEAAASLVEAARRMRTLEPTAARDALLSAATATVLAGWAGSAPLLRELARTARDLAPTGGPPDSAANLLLQGYATRATEGYAAAVPTLRRAIRAVLADESELDVALHRLEAAAFAAGDLFDHESVARLTARWVRCARESGAVSRLAPGLAFRSAFVDAPEGRLDAARAAQSEARELAEATNNPGVVPRSGAHTLPVLVLSGQESKARSTAAVVARETPPRGAAGEAAFAAYCAGLLDLSLGNYEAAVAALHPAWTDDTPLVGTQALPDLVEAAVRAGRAAVAEQALQRLEERALATGTTLALGLLARSRALLATPAEARDEYENAIRLLADTSATPQTARAHLLYGEWLRRQRRRREARDQLRAAYDLFDAMDLRAFAERAQVELRATGEHAHRRDLGQPEELTPQEARIATLVGQGQANRDIATALFISPSTVEYHLHKVFRKTGVTSRTQLARHLMSTGAPAP